MTASTQQLFAISALVGECESLTGSGDLNESQERSLRLLIAHVLSAFHMASKHERASPLLEIVSKDTRLVTVTRADYTADEFMFAINKQLQAARILWPQLTSVEIADHRSTTG